MKKKIFLLIIYSIIFINKTFAQNNERLIDSAMNFYNEKQYEKCYEIFSGVFKNEVATRSMGYNYYCFSVAAEKSGKTIVANEYLIKAIQVGVVKSFAEIDYVKKNHPLYLNNSKNKATDSLISSIYMVLRNAEKNDSIYFLKLQNPINKINSNEGALSYIQKLKSTKLKNNELLVFLSEFANFSVAPKTCNFVLYFYTTPNEKIPYILFIPKNYSPKKEHELYVYLHGGTASIENFTFTEQHSKEEPIFKWANDKNKFILYPLGKKTAGWHEGDESIKNVYGMINEIRKLYNINDNKITFSGMSNGARGVIYTALNQPKHFKDFIAISSNADDLIIDSALLNNLSNGYSLNLLHGTIDDVYSYIKLKKAVTGIYNKNISLKLSSFYNGEHGFIYSDSGYNFLCKKIKEISLSPKSILKNKISWFFDSNKDSEYLWLKTIASTKNQIKCYIDIEKSGNDFYIKKHYGPENNTKIVINLFYKEIDLKKPICIYNELNQKIFEKVITLDKTFIIDKFEENFDRKNILIYEINLSL